MRSCGLALALVACSSAPTLSVAVDHRDELEVTRTVVTVYAGSDVSCEQISLGDRTPLELAAITSEEVDVTAGGAIEVGRLGDKAIVARGYDAQRRFVTAGCTDLGELTGATAITIATQPTAVVAIDPGLPERPFSERTILVNMSDTAGRTIKGDVSWQLTGPAGTVDQRPATGVATNGNGDAKIEVQDLARPGPQGLRIRVPWAIAPLPLVTAFDVSHGTTISLGTGVAGNPSCDLRGHAGRRPTLVCLTASPTAHRDVIEIAWQTDRYVATTIAIPGAIDNQYALFVDHDGSADEPVYVVGGVGSSGSWYELGAPAATPVTLSGPLQNVVYVARCKDHPTALVAVQSGSALASTLRTFLPSGAPIGNPVASEVFSGGCVADIDGVEHQAIVAGSVADPTLIVLQPGGQIRVGSARLSGSGFITSQAQGVIEKRFAGTRLQATGTVVYQAVLAREGASYRLVERTETEAAGPPTKIFAGQLDLDADTDLIWDLAITRRRLFQVSLAKQVLGVPLTAITSGPTAAFSPGAAASDFVVGDLNGLGIDEVVLVSASAVTIYTPD
jgi:hypothetical protein